MRAFAAASGAHRRQIWFTNPLGRVHREIKRRTDVAGVLSRATAVNRFVTAVIAEQRDECQVAEGRYLAAPMAALMQPPDALPAGTRLHRRLAS